jgi:ferric-dicitrate binding protein FerR (iron transport regulator)
MEQHFSNLVQKYLTNSLTASEQEELVAMSRLQEHRVALEEMITADMQENAFGEEEDPALKQQMFDQLETRIAEWEATPAVRTTPVRKLLIRFAAVAAVVAALSAGYYFLLQDKKVRQQNAEKRSQENIAPGSNKATLTLADGSTIALDDSKEGNLTTQGGVKVMKLDSGMLAYKAPASGGKMVFNTITTPRGGQFQLLLSDGSHITLNSASSLKFPTAFNGESREVILTGEAFFEVTEDAAKPFRVKAGETTVEVLGTSFNIMSYTNEPLQSTTLVEGTVKLNALGLAQILRPGEQAVLNYQSNRVQVRSADVEEAIAWKNGKFQFVKKNINTIMRQIERWYDVDVEFKGDFSDVVLSGVVSRKEHVFQLLEALEETGDVHFQTTGKHITALPGSK